MLRNLLPFLIGAPLLVHAQTTTYTNSLGQTVEVNLPSSFRKSTPARDWPTMEEKDIPARERKKQRNDFARHPILNEAALLETDGALQTAYPKSGGRAPLQSWNGQNGGAPPDPTGAAGPNHYVQAVNTSYRVFSKTGSSMSGAMQLSTLWPGSSSSGDPIVLYDRHADRWFISQFDFSPNRMLIAVSETNDPLGAYYGYEYTFSQFPDYPKFSIWWDGYYFTSNSNKTAAVFDRDKMLAGDPSAQMVALTAPNNGSNFFTSVLPADADGPLPPAGTPCYFFNLEDNAWGNPQDQIRVYEMTTNWANPGSTSVVSTQTLATAAFNTAFGSGFSNIAQPGSTQKLDAVSEILYFRAQHTRWTNHNSVVLCHVVDVGGDQAGMRWYELRDANDGNWSIHQQGTYSPDDGNRWMASIAMDDQGNIGMGYCHNDVPNNIHAGLRFTGRWANDPLGEMTLGESIAITGTAAQTGLNRYGDYSHMSIDPDGSTFWFTGEYLGAGGNNRTRIFSFDLANSIGIEDNGNEMATSGLTVTVTGDVANVVLEGLKNDDALSLSLVDMDGRTVLERAARPGGKRFTGTIDLHDLSSGAYFVRVTKSGFQKVQRIVVAR